jgi:hypothetical protein
MGYVLLGRWELRREWRNGGEGKYRKWGGVGSIRNTETESKELKQISGRDSLGPTEPRKLRLANSEKYSRNDADAVMKPSLCRGQRQLAQLCTTGRIITVSDNGYLIFLGTARCCMETVNGRPRCYDTARNNRTVVFSIGIAREIYEKDTNRRDRGQTLHNKENAAAAVWRQIPFVRKKKWSRVPDGGLIPGQTCRLTVGLKITLTLT